MEKKSWQDEYLTMIDDCEKRESRMNDWEIGFINIVFGILDMV